VRTLMVPLAGVGALVAAVPAQDTGRKARIGPETAPVVIDVQQIYFEGGLVPLTGSAEELLKEF
jgi:hypothetical protein